MTKNSKILLRFSIIILLLACKSPEGSQNSSAGVTNVKLEEPRIITGAEQLSSYLPMLSGKRVGLVVNQTSVVGSTHLVDTLLSIGVNIVKVFAPEHGFRGDHSAGATIRNAKDERTGLPILSLYGRTKKPTPEMIKDLDIIVFDIQDVGVRFYTYISTMHYVMEAAAEHQKEVLVLDRPNPNGFYVDGPVLDPAYQSFIGMHKIPVVHGCTVAELAKMINGEGWLQGGVKCKLEVVACRNYKHSMVYELPIQPSPNLPNMNSIYLYPYLGLFEGTNVSIGRGTPTPFQIVGRPGYEGSITFTPKSIPGVADKPKYMGVECGGEIVNDVQDSIIFKNPGLNLHWLLLMYQANLDDNGPYFKSFFHKLCGTDQLQEQIENDWTISEIKESWQPDLRKYKEMRKKYLLY
jgi:uncharacterized protein YbbC (DUF1343 family)